MHFARTGYLSFSLLEDFRRCRPSQHIFDFQLRELGSNILLGNILVGYQLEKEQKETSYLGLLSVESTLEIHYRNKLKHRSVHNLYQ